MELTLDIRLLAFLVLLLQLMPLLSHHRAWGILLGLGLAVATLIKCSISYWDAKGQEAAMEGSVAIVVHKIVTYWFQGHPMAIITIHRIQAVGVGFSYLTAESHQQVEVSLTFKLCH
jgi:hypothetical protein